MGRWSGVEIPGGGRCCAVGQGGGGGGGHAEFHQRFLRPQRTCASGRGQKSHGGREGNDGGGHRMRDETARAYRRQGRNCHVYGQGVQRLGGIEIREKLRML